VEIEMSNTFRSVAWDHGCFAVQSLAGMLGPATFVLRDGRQAQPLQVAPWTFEPQASSLPPILRRLRGEWPCVPFGGDAERDLPPGWSASGETISRDEPFHGRSSNEEWRFLDAPEGSVALAIDYPASHPIRSLVRRVTPDPNAAAVDFDLEVIARRACSLPIALHPTFRMPQRPGALRLEPGPYDHVRTFPGTVEPGASLFPRDVRFARLEEAPTRAGGVVDISRLPLHGRVEELLLLVNCRGSVALHDGENGWRVHMIWDPRHFPCLQFWISNRGRREYPWSGRHLGLGVEPVCGAFDLGPAVSNAPNPIAAAGAPTAYRFSPDERFVTRYRIEVEAS
jgi:hypothetical protein